MQWLGDRNAGSTVRFGFNTNAVAGESITIGTNGTIAIYKDGSTTERSSANGITFVEDHDAHTGTHTIAIDLSDNTDAGFYAAGSTYMVKYHTATIDGKAISAWVAGFTIDLVNQKADVAKWLGTAAETPTTAGRPNVNVKSINDIAATSVATIGAYLGGTAAHAIQSDLALVKTATNTGVAPGASGGILISGTNSGTTTLGALTVSGATTLTGAVTASNASNNIQVRLQDGVTHGGTTALLRLGSSTSTPAFHVTNSGGNAVALEATGSNGNGLYTVGDGTGAGILGEGNVLSGYGVRLTGSAGFSVPTVSFGTLTVTSTTTLTGAVSATNASNDIVGIDVKKLSGDATAADNAEAFFDGTGYAGTGNTIPTVTNLTNAPTSGDLTATMKTSVNTEVASQLVTKGLDHLVSTSVIGTDIADNSIIARIASKSAIADWDSFTNTTDSLEAIRDRGDEAWITGSSGTGTGARTVTVTVTDSGATPIQNARVRLTSGATSYSALTNVSGVIVFNLDDATWTVAITAVGYSFSGTTLVVDGTETPTYVMTTNSVPTPSDPTLSTGSLYCYNTAGAIEAGVIIRFELTTGLGTAGRALDRGAYLLTSDVAGLIQGTFIRGAIYRGRRGTTGIWYTFTVPNTGTFNLPEILGSP